MRTVSAMPRPPAQTDGVIGGCYAPDQDPLYSSIGCITSQSSAWAISSRPSRTGRSASRCIGRAPRRAPGSRSRPSTRSRAGGRSRSTGRCRSSGRRARTDVGVRHGRSRASAPSPSSPRPALERRDDRPPRLPHLLVAPGSLPVADPADAFSARLHDRLLARVRSVVPGLAVDQLLGGLGTADMPGHIGRVEFLKERQAALAPRLEPDVQAFGAHAVILPPPVRPGSSYAATVLRTGTRRSTEGG